MKSTSSFSTILLLLIYSLSLSLLSLFPTLTFAILPPREIFVRSIPPIPCFPFPSTLKNSIYPNPLPIFQNRHSHSHSRRQAGRFQCYDITCVPGPKGDEGCRFEGCGGGCAVRKSKCVDGEIFSSISSSSSVTTSSSSFVTSTGMGTGTTGTAATGLSMSGNSSTSVGWSTGYKKTRHGTTCTEGT